jgi:hydroxymethylglutaryl-CoA synthase
VLGVSAIGLAIPSLALPVEELARLNNIDPDKYTVGLGASRMALCGPDENAATLAVSAAQKALAAWGGDPADLGLIAVGTESSDNFSRPMTQALCAAFELSGSIRSYEVKHACLGGTLAIRQALEWMASGVAGGQSALVVASDVCRYGRGDDSEPTQGAGAVAFIIGEPTVAALSLESYRYSLPIDDFHWPVTNDFPIVNGRTSHRSYQQAAAWVFDAWAGADPKPLLDSMAAYAFHCPFPRMVEKAFVATLRHLGCTKDDAIDLYRKAAEPHLAWNRRIGNCYTASLWFTVAHALAHSPTDSALAAFSYGSGCGAELVFASPTFAGQPYWAVDLERALDRVTELSGNEYRQLRQPALT